jgi:hypothetical protein
MTQVYFGSHIAVPVLVPVAVVVASPPAPPVPPVVVALVVVSPVVVLVVPPVPAELVVVPTVHAPRAKAASAPRMIVKDRWFMFANPPEKASRARVKDGGNVAHRPPISTAQALDFVLARGRQLLPAEVAARAAPTIRRCSGRQNYTSGDVAARALRQPCQPR